MPKRYVSFERMIGNVFFDSQSRFFQFPITFFQTSNPFFVRNPLSLRENGKSLATLQRPRNMLAFTDVTVARARNLLPHLPRFPVLVRSVFPVPFPYPMQHSIPLPSNRPPGCGKCCKRIAGSCHRNSYDSQRVGRCRCKVARVFPNCLYSIRNPLLIY